MEGYKEKLCREGLWQELEALLQKALEEEVFPGAEVLLARGGDILFQRCWGKNESEEGALTLKEGSLFDIASLTKPLACGLGMAFLVKEGVVSWEDKVGKFFPSWKKGAKKEASLKNLLTHSSGLPAWLPLYKRAENKAQALELVLQTGLRKAPGEGFIYSDLGYILLGELVPLVCGKSLAELFYAQIAGPLGLEETVFSPLFPKLAEKALKGRYSSFRGRWLKGEVDDDNCALLGGCAGHAGLFSTAKDVHTLVSFLLRGGRQGSRYLLEPADVASLFSNHNQPKLPPFGLGWDIKAPKGYTSAGKSFPSGSVGHLGFSGASLWVDPKTGITALLLAHRVNSQHPKAQERLKALRPKVNNLLYLLADKVVGE